MEAGRKKKSVGEGEYASVLDLVTSLPPETMLARTLVLEVLNRTRKKEKLYSAGCRNTAETKKVSGRNAGGVRLEATSQHPNLERGAMSC